MGPAQSMRLVFRLDGIGFSLPIADVVEVRANVESWVWQPPTGTGEVAQGQIPFRGEMVDVYDLRPAFGLPPREREDRLTALVVYGREGGLALLVDTVEGIFAWDEFELREIPPLLCRETQDLYREVAVWRDEPLVNCEIDTLSRIWSGE